MRRRPVLAATCVAVGFAAAPALADATYPPVGPTATATVAPTTQVLPERLVREPVKEPEIPFTGQEIALLTIVGSAAVAGGTVLVVVVRRRRTKGAHS